MAREADGWTVVKVTPEQMAMIFLDGQLEHVLYRERSEHSDIIVRLASSTGLTFLTKFIDQDGSHVYVFVGGDRIEIKQGYSVLQFLQRYKVHVSGVVGSGFSGLHAEVFLTGEKIKKREFYYRNVYDNNEKTRRELLEQWQIQTIMKDLTPQVLYPLLTHSNNKLLAWFVNLPIS